MDDGQGVSKQLQLLMRNKLQSIIIPHDNELATPMGVDCPSVGGVIEPTGVSISKQQSPKNIS